MNSQKTIAVMMENIEYGGATTHLKTLIKNKVFSKTNFILITNKSNKAIGNSFKIKNKNIKIIFYNSLNVLDMNSKILKILFLVFKPLFFLLSILQMYKLFKKIKFDLLIANCGGYGDFRSEMACLIANKILKNQKIYLLIHHCYTKPLFWSFLINIFNYFISHCILGVIFVSKATKLTIKKNTALLNNKMLNNTVIHNGVEIKKYSKQIISSLKTNSKIIKIGMLSRIEEYKGQLDLIEAFNKLPKNYKSKCIVFLVGSGKIRDLKLVTQKIKSLKLMNKIKLVNYVNEDSYKIINNFDLLISATRDFEAFGYSIAEALFVKTPVICTNVGGVKEYVNNKNAIIIQPNNIQSVKKSLIYFISNKKKINKKISNGHKMIKEKFNSDIMCKKFFKYFSYA